MNIFVRELKAHWKSLLGWSIAMILLIASGMAKFTSLGPDGQNANQLFGAFPKPVLVILGIQGLDLSTAIGYFGVIFLYLQLTASIHAAMLGSEIISKEERDKTSEFLFVKPVTRLRAVTEKLLAGLLNLIVLNAVTMASSIAMVAVYANNYHNNNLIIMMMAGLFIMQLIFFALGASLAGYFKNPKLPSIVATTILLVTYIIWVIFDLNSKLDFLKYLTPFRYFDASVMIGDGHLDLFYVALSLVITTVLIIVSYLSFNKRDLKV